MNCSQNLQTRLLQRRIVIAVEIIQPDDVPAFGQELAGDVKADKAGGARDQNCLIRHPIPKYRSPRLRRPVEPL